MIARKMSVLVLVATTAVLGLFLAAPTARADSATIFDMRKSLPLENGEVATREFYVNGGPEVGLRDGMFVRVLRIVPIHDPIGNKSQGLLTVPVGFVKIIHSEKGVAVARPYSELTDDERPTLEYEGIMIGDRLDLASATSDEPRARKRKAPAAAPAAARQVEPTVVAPSHSIG